MVLVVVIVRQPCIIQVFFAPLVLPCPTAAFVGEGPTAALVRDGLTAALVGEGTTAGDEGPFPLGQLHVDSVRRIKP